MNEGNETSSLLFITNSSRFVRLLNDWGNSDRKLLPILRIRKWDKLPIDSGKDYDFTCHSQMYS